MPQPATEMVTHPSAARRSSSLYRESEQNIHQQTDRLFVYLMGLQWLAGIIFALLISPRAWVGISSSLRTSGPLSFWAA